ncbi:hypothetical protein ACWDSJ_24240 [Nocardia sp. NPDC003482]
MTLEFTSGAIFSDKTPEVARFVGAGEDGGWVLSWLPGRRLDRARAAHGMVLDEILSDPRLVDDEVALEMAAVRAAELGLTLEGAVALLCLRVVDRLLRPSVVSAA